MTTSNTTAGLSETESDTTSPADKSDVLYEGENIRITARKIVAGQTTFAVDAIQSLSIARYSKMGWPALIVGFGALISGGAMTSCTSVFLATMHGENPGEWIRNGWLIIGSGILILLFGRRIPPHFFIVQATIGGQTRGIYRTNSIAQAKEIERAITTARGL